MNGRKRSAHPNLGVPFSGLDTLTPLEYVKKSLTYGGGSYVFWVSLAGIGPLLLTVGTDDSLHPDTPFCGNEHWPKAPIWNSLRKGAWPICSCLSQSPKPNPCLIGSSSASSTGIGAQEEHTFGHSPTEGPRPTHGCSTGETFTSRSKMVLKANFEEKTEIATCKWIRNSMGKRRLA